MLNVTRRLLLAGSRRRGPSAGRRRPRAWRVEPPEPILAPSHGYVNLFNRSGRSYEVAPLDEDARLPRHLRLYKPYLRR